jgi:hypothetical protein
MPTVYQAVNTPLLAWHSSRNNEAQAQGQALEMIAEYNKRVTKDQNKIKQ